MWSRRLTNMVLACAVLAAAYLAYDYLQRHRVTPSQASVQLSALEPTVQVYALQRSTSRVAWTLYGEIEPRHVARMQAMQSGKVRTVNVKKGDSVAKGDLLVALDAPLVQLKLDKALSQREEVRMQLTMQQKTTRYEQDRLKQAQQTLAWIEKKYSRSKQLLGKKVISQEQFDNVSMELDRYKHALEDANYRVAASQSQEKLLITREKQYQIAEESARVELAQARIASPMDGRVHDVAVAVGDDARAGAPLVTVQSDQWRVRSMLPYDKTRELLRHQSVGSVQADAVVDGRDHPLTLESTHASSVFVGNDVLFGFKEHADSLWQHGQTVKIVVSVPAPANAWTVPASSLYRSQYVYVLQADHTLARVDVVFLGFSADSGDPVVASDALGAGSLLVERWQGDWVSGMKVRVDA